MSEKIIRCISSRGFFIGIVVLFILQGLVFAIAVAPSYSETQPDGYVTRSGGVVPDGNRHIGAMYFYAERPILSGPFVDDMTDNDLWLGDLERFPSYLYQYALSFPVRAGQAIGMSDWGIVLMIRIVSLALGVLALVVFRRIALAVHPGKAIANLATLALAVTGSFAWLSPAENYDIPALLLWFVFVLLSLQLFQRRDSTRLYWMAVVFFVLSVTKYTYIPFAGVAGLAAVILFAHAVGYRRSASLVTQQWTDWWKRLKSWRIGLYALLLIVAGGLFVERIGVNLVSYQSFSPGCTQVHSHETCMKFGVYSRNFNRASKIDSGEIAPIQVDVADYTGTWVKRYYYTMYAYLGHVWIYDYWTGFDVIAIASLLVLLVLIVFAKIRRVRLLQSRSEVFILGLAVMLIVAQYLVNIGSFIRYAGEMYAHQGRYLLPAVGLLYVTILITLARAVGAASDVWRPRVIVVLAVFGFIVLVGMSALVSFWLHAWSLEWFSQPIQDILPAGWFGFREWVFYHLTG